MKRPQLLLAVAAVAALALFPVGQTRPLQHGLAELVAYLQLSGDTFKTVVDEDVVETIVWSREGQDGREVTKQARLPRVIFVR